MFDDARMNAFVKVLYRDGYDDINQANYEAEIEKSIDGWDIINYTFIYPERQNVNIQRETYYGKDRVVVRKNDSVRNYSDVEDKRDIIREYYKEFELRR